jgi:[protein-PII] uridylyltransferase
LATAEAVEIIEQKRNDIVNSAPNPETKENIAALFNSMSPRYRLYTPAPVMLEHIDLYHRLGNVDFLWDIKNSTESNTRSVTICAKDRPGLISKIAGVFTLNNIDILDVQVFTWHNHIALDIFEVKPPPDQIMESEKWLKAKRNLTAALSGKLNLAAALNKKLKAHRHPSLRRYKKPHRIEVDNTSSSFFTIIEVFTYDFPGLLHGITDALFQCELNIWVAKIATKADQVVDVFYVRDLNGEKVDSSDQVALVKAAIQERLPAME